MAHGQQLVDTSGSIEENMLLVNMRFAGNVFFAKDIHHWVLNFKFGVKSD
jgi:hypothetical protein